MSPKYNVFLAKMGLSSVAGKLDAKPYFVVAGERALTEALETRGIKAKVTHDPKTNHYRVTYLLPQDKPLVSIVIPVVDRDNFSVKELLLHVRENTNYKNTNVLLHVTES